MSFESIFDGIVREENTYTQLLCNLMARADGFRHEVLKALLESDLALGISGEEIVAQQRSLEAGCPDIKVASDEVYALIEVKTYPKRTLTENQKLICEKGKFGGYAGEVAKAKQGKKTVKARRLVYLVPRNWELGPSLEKEKEILKNQLRAAGLEVKIKYWDEILRIADKYTDDPLIEEFKNLMTKSFESFSFSLHELDLLFSGKSRTAYTAVVKAERLVDRVLELAREAGYEAKLEVKSGRGEEYGLYIMDAKDREFCGRCRRSLTACTPAKAGVDCAREAAAGAVVADAVLDPQRASADGRD